MDGEVVSIGGKPVAEISEEDLQRLITDNVRESQTLDFKRESYGRNSDEIREMLRDISAIGNAFGGDLLIGVEEDGEGVAINLPGVDNADEEAQRIVSSCLSNLQERIPGLVAWPVPLNNARHVIVIRIPRSLRAPHMVTFRGLNQFWIRHDTQKSPMSVHEIREACLKVEGLMEKVDRFFQKRREKFLREIGNTPHYIVSVTPIFVDTEVVEIRDHQLRNLLSNPPGQRAGGWSVSFGQAPLPFLHGLRSEIRNWKSLDLFRNGHLELRIRVDNSFFYDHRIQIEGEETRVFHAYALVEYPVSLIRLARAIYSHLGLTDPVIVSLSLYNIRGFALMPAARPDIQLYLATWGHLAVPWRHSHLEVPSRQTPSLEHPDRIAKECADRIWQSFGFEEAPLFDGEGNFTP